MPTVDYKCKYCGHSFNRVALRGEEAGKTACPKCRREATPSSQGPTGLFNGISSFSSLSKDTN